MSHDRSQEPASPSDHRGSIESAGPADIPVDQWLAVLDDCADGVGVVVPGPWRLVYANRALLSWLAADARPRSGRPLVEILPAATSDQVLPQLDAVLRGEAESLALADHMLFDAGGPPLVVRLRRVSVGGQSAVALIARQLDDQPNPVSDVDSLTGLASRSFVLSRLEELLHGERQGDRHFAVLFIDLNEFKWVNDTYGHLVGDRALREVAGRLATCVRAGDHIARFGGDEFLVLLESVRDEADIQPVLDRIHSVLKSPVALPAGSVTITASVGVAEASPAHRTADDLLAAADLAMYASKRHPD